MPSYSFLKFASLLFFTAFTGLAAAEESLLDPSTARTLTPTEQQSFGPRSTGRHYDPRMIEAAKIAKHRAEPRKTWLCWRYVKDALVQAGLVSSRPKSA